jgi:hypothetical protein
LKYFYCTILCAFRNILSCQSGRDDTSGKEGAFQCSFSVYAATAKTGCFTYGIQTGDGLVGFEGLGLVSKTLLCRSVWMPPRLFRDSIFNFIAIKGKAF